MGKIGNQSVAFEEPPYIRAGASVVGPKEGQGPFGKLFDVVIEEPMNSENNWETAESDLQTTALKELFSKSGIKKEEIRYLFGGDLLGQLIATTFGVKDYEIPFFGLYGAGGM